MKAIACELPREQGLPLSRFSRAELHRLVIERGVSEASASTIARWLAEDALKPWQHRSWIFPTDPAFLEKAGPVLDLYQGRWQGKLLHPGEFVICADEKPSIQARARIHAPLPPGSGSRGQRVEHTYKRNGALTYLAALDIGRRGGRRPRVFGRSEAQRRDRALRPARPAGDDQGALRLRAPRLLDRRQRLLPPRPESRSSGSSGAGRT